jgi:hypothetical protein
LVASVQKAGMHTFYSLDLHLRCFETRFGFTHLDLLNDKHWVENRFPRASLKRDRLSCQCSPLF